MSSYHVPLETYEKEADIGENRLTTSLSEREDTSQSHIYLHSAETYDESWTTHYHGMIMIYVFVLFYYFQMYY